MIFTVETYFETDLRRGIECDSLVVIKWRKSKTRRADHTFYEAIIYDVLVGRKRRR